MDQPIVKIEDIQAMAARDHAAGLARDDHGFNWHAMCLPTYLQERDRLAGASKVAHAAHSAPAGRKRIDLRQGAV